MLTGRLVGVRDSEKRSIGSLLSRMAGRSGEPVIRTAIRQAMRIMGHQYVMGRTIEEAMKRADKKSNRRFRYSFDMLGEAALTAARSEEHTSELQSRGHLVCRLLLEKKKSKESYTAHQ